MPPRMLRLALFSAVLLAVSGCNPCARVAAAEASSTQKGKACNASATDWSDSKLQACTKNLSDCSPSDLQKMDEYAACLNQIATCEAGKELTFAASRIDCVKKIVGVSLACGSF